MKKREAFVDAVERLEQQRVRGKPIKDRPSSLPVSEIRTAPEVFQPRGLYSAEHVDELHVRSLRQALEAQGRKAALQPILVMWIGRKVYCIDGHHRLAAYKAYGKLKTLPVEWCDKSVPEAAEEAVRRNIQDKLPMRREAKLEAAWRMVVRGQASKREITLATTVPASTIANMRHTLKSLEERGRADDFRRGSDSGDATFRCRLTWAEAKRVSRQDFESGEDWEEEKVNVWADRLAKAFGKKWGEQPELAAAAIARFSERLPVKLVEVWRDDGLLEDFEWDPEE